MWYKHPIYDYSADEEGNIRNDRTGRLCKQTPTRDGYLEVFIRRARLDYKTYASHRLILECLNGEMIPKGMQSDHINADRSDNRAQNLRLTTAKGNSRNPNYLKLRREIARRPKASKVPLEVLEDGVVVRKYESLRAGARGEGLPFMTLWARVKYDRCIDGISYNAIR